MFKLSTPALLRCMRSAVKAGFDPYNSATVQARVYARAWHDKCRRTRSEFSANLALGA